MKTDLEKIEYLATSLDLYTERYVKENEIVLAIYYWNIYLGSACFNLDGSLIMYNE